MVFADRNLSRRLQRVEGYACVHYAEARRRLTPDSDAEWVECAGAVAVFDGAQSPVTQSFGLGVFEELGDASLHEIESFFFDRGAAADHEVSPLAGVGAVSLLSQRGYRPVEISNVLYRATEPIETADGGDIRVRVIDAGELEWWAEINARGWAQEYSEVFEFVRSSGAISTGRKGGVCFLAELAGRPGATGALALHEGVAL